MYMIDMLNSGLSSELRFKPFLYSFVFLDETHSASVEKKWVINQRYPDRMLGVICF